jgi:peptidoglycan/LPS O-acetylase OafA/YrhL
MCFSILIVIFNLNHLFILRLIMRYLKQIDGLRAFAVIGVIIHHWTTVSTNFSFLMHLGAFGVDLFFVISGFLITTILIKEKNNGKKIIENIKIFYIRRSLRIFPIYYIFLILIFIFNWTEIKPNALSLLGYYFNFDMYFNGWAKFSYVQHLWSLSVEEQFYIFWPLIVFLFINKNNFYIFIPLLIVVSFVFCLSFLLFSPYKEVKLFTPFAFMSLFLGSLLSYIKDRNIKVPYSSIFIIVFLSIFLLLKLDLIPHFYGKNIIGYLIPFPSLMFFLLVNKAADGYKGVAKVILENNFLCFIGKISYGLYIYHMIIPHLFFDNISYINIFYNTLILFVIALSSWYLIENPINKLKNRFSYKESKDLKKLVVHNNINNYQDVSRQAS